MNFRRTFCDRGFLFYAVLVSCGFHRNVVMTSNKRISEQENDDPFIHMDTMPVLSKDCGPSQFYCDGEFGGKCIPEKWKCDRASDCNDETDEPPECSPRTCSPTHFQCRLTGICLPLSYKCNHKSDCGFTKDGNVDSSDENDEAHCEASLTCPSNSYKCQSVDVCVELEKFCDNHVDCIDGSDEGTFCNTSANNNVNCTYGRKPMPPNGVYHCYCPKGQKPLQNECIDDDECSREKEGFASPCDQNCTKLFQNYQCGCFDGYELIGKTNCRAINEPIDENATIFFTNGNSIIHTDLNFSTVYGKIEGSIEAMDIDHRNRSVCWMEKKGGKLVIQCASVDKFHKNFTWFYEPEYSLTGVHQMVKDWVSGNWYFACAFFRDRRLFVCNENFSICNTLFTGFLNHLKDLAVDPSRGYIFVTDYVVSQSGLVQMNMDGSKFIQLGNLSHVHPYGVTLDYAKGTVYWWDYYLEQIHVLDYDAVHMRRTIANQYYFKKLNGLTLFENYLYATNNHQNTILRISKNNGSSIKVFVNSDYVGAYSIRVFHRQRQPKVDHPCAVNNGGCDHLCLVSFVERGNGVAKCTCREGYMLINDKKCSQALSFPFLLFGNAHPESIMGIPLNKPEAGYQSIIPIRNLMSSESITFIVETSEIYFVNAASTIMKQKLNSNLKVTVIDSGISHCKGLAVDWMSKNLYWSDEKLKTINVARLTNTNIRKIIASSNMSQPRAVAVHPSIGFVFWSDCADLNNISAGKWVAKIERSNLDGSDRRTLIMNDIHWPNSFTIDFQNDVLFWCDTYFHRIEKANLDGTHRKTIITRIYPFNPYGIAYFDGFLFYTEFHTAKVMRITLNETKFEVVKMYDDPSPFAHLLEIHVYDVNEQKNTNLCSGILNGGCEHFCFFVNSNVECDCADGFAISSTDSNLCVPICQENVRNSSVDCICPSKYYGTNCERNLSCDGYCLNGGTCKETSDKIKCLCTHRYTGARCQQSRQILLEDYENIGKTIAIIVAPLIIISLSVFLIYHILLLRRKRCVQIQFKHTKMLDSTVQNVSFLRRKENDSIFLNEMETNFSNPSYDPNFYDTKAMV